MESLADAMQPVLAKIAELQKLGTERISAAARGDSYLEERFWSLIDSTVKGQGDSLDQFEIGQYRVDAIFLVSNNHAVVIELDGNEFHRDRCEEDRQRDKEILRSVSAVIRIRYKDLMERPRSTVHALGAWYDRFKERTVLPFGDHDNPNTAPVNLTVRTGYGTGTDADVIKRIQEGRRVK